MGSWYSYFCETMHAVGKGNWVSIKGLDSAGTVEQLEVSETATTTASARCRRLLIRTAC